MVGKIKGAEKLKLEDLKRCYLFTSKSSYILDEKVSSIKKSFRGKINFDTDFRVFDATSDIEEKEFNNFITTPSFFSIKKLLVIKNVEHMSSHLLNSLVDMLTSSDDSIIFVITSTRSKLDSRLVEAAKKVGEIQNIRSPLSNDLKKWVEEKSELDGIKFTNRAINILVESVGSDLSLLKAEYEKLYTYVISEKEKLINEEMVKSLISRTYFLKVFDLVDFIGARDKQNSLKALKDVIEERQSLIGMLTLIYRMFKCLMYFKYENGRELVKEYLQRNINVQDYFINNFINKLADKYEKFSSNYSEGEIVKILGILNHYDINFRKSSAEESVNLANRLVLEILGS